MAWTNRLCELIGGFAASQQSAPPVDKSNRDAFKSSLVAQLDSALQAADDTLTGLRKIQPSPIKGGDGVTDAFEKSFVRAHDILSTAKTKAEHIDTSDQESFTAGQQAVQKEVKKGQSVFGSAFSRFNENRALLEAAAEAPACKPLTNPSSQVPRTSQQPPQ
ncbi:hypothetical protein [Haloactinomyces albus]|uniref:Uncharacterized protein n=1 Tax=Haloactinomyces albus TaxID=1352928 RepID=A0AAE4CPH8_9ACTN|nr:hypothetical protein [Haloactinomyces albus]MDR7301708.1 hypothetical protein [Haloactinomyces albus]